MGEKNAQNETGQQPVPEGVETDIIPPSPGRIVHFYPAGGDHNITPAPSAFGGRGRPLPAIITMVLDYRRVNLAVFHADGKTSPWPNTPLVQPGEEPPESGQAYACWMPYQKGQAAQAQAPGAPERELAALAEQMETLEGHLGQLYSRLEGVEGAVHGGDPLAKEPDDAADQTQDGSGKPADTLGVDAMDTRQVEEDPGDPDNPPQVGSAPGQEDPDPAE